ncbi:MAG: YtxH domain-containing protein [Bacteroidales bacterium]|uniref:YtxH domain-containing protein n=1 Tax=Porphyromonas sp. TaxID=1924944 RepID=UPI0029744E22|nr:YtxH domain-containing protein [Porphyromonas sp.]MDD7437232.1 YtxH domain-containing protein [Bacteroidales bacterium]MDY3066483.1 YtxH domain-containing protein [Porphyromonas sp.]
MRSNDGVKILIGVAIGTAIGAALAYFSDSQKRNQFIDDVSDYSDKVKNNVKDVYYDGKIRARKAKRDLSRYMADVKDEAGTFYDDMVNSARGLGRKAKHSVEELADLTQEELADLKEAAREEAEKLARD